MIVLPASNMKLKLFGQAWFLEYELQCSMDLEKEKDDYCWDQHTIPKCKKMAEQNTFQNLVLTGANMIGEH